MVWNKASKTVRMSKTANEKVTLIKIIMIRRRRNTTKRWWNKLSSEWLHRDSSIYVIEIRAQEWFIKGIRYELVGKKTYFFRWFWWKPISWRWWFQLITTCISLQMSTISKKKKNPKTPIGILICNKKRLTICFEFTCLILTLFLLNEWYKKKSKNLPRMKLMEHKIEA